MGKVIYMTGAPASGKSSTTQILAKMVPDLLVWEYGAQLTSFVQQRSSAALSQQDIRERSSLIVTPDDVAKVDLELQKFVAANRMSNDIIIDSHPVTKERYGFRITPFSLQQFRELAPDEIWVLYASPALTMARIAEDPAGRPAISAEEARMHTELQSSVAATYGTSIGAAVYVFDTALDRQELALLLAGRLAKGGM